MKIDFIRNKVLVFLIVLIIIILVILGMFLYKILKKNRNEINEQEQGEDFIETYGKSTDNNISEQSYFDVNSCIRQYLSIINLNNDIYYTYNKSNDYVKVEDKQIKQTIYNILGQKYINQNNITINNVFDYVKTLDETSLFIPLEISMIQDSGIKSFLVHGLVESLNLTVIDEIFAVVNIDMVNSKFSIQPIYGKYSSIDDLKDKTLLETNIIDSDNNKFTMSTVTYEVILKEYINFYKRLAIGAPETAYKYLDKEYRKARYGSVEEFKKYIKENKDTINSISLDKYQETDKENSKQYVGIDKNGFYYIFNQKSIMDFTIITDTHSIDLPEFITQYEKATEQEKVAMNINKIIEALNMKDYKYVYNKFSDGFKENYFKTEQKFINYAEKYFKNNNKVIFNEYSKKSNNTYVYNITLKDKNNNSTLELNTDILMRLSKGTDFIISMSGINPEVIYNGF